MNVLLPAADIYTHSVTPSNRVLWTVSTGEAHLCSQAVHVKGLQASMNRNEQLLYLHWSYRSCHLQIELKNSEYITDRCSLYL